MGKDSREDRSIHRGAIRTECRTRPEGLRVGLGNESESICGGTREGSRVDSRTAEMNRSTLDLRRIVSCERFGIAMALNGDLEGTGGSGLNSIETSHHDR